MVPTGGIFGHLGRFLGRVLFGSPTPGPRQQGGGHHHIPPPKKKSDPLEIHHTITPRGSSSRALVPITTAAQKSYAAEYNRLYGILQNELAGLKTALAPRDRQRNRRHQGTRRAGADIPPETTRQDPRPYNKRDTTRHGYVNLDHGYQDGQDVDVDSSWIGAFNFRPLGGDYGGNQDPRDIGDLTMVVLRPSAPNPSGRYTYPRVPRPIMGGAMLAPSKGRFYWSTLRHFSNRMAIGKRMMSTGRRLMKNPTSPHAGPRRLR